MIIKMKNIDTLFFRDGKPFGSIDDNWADSLSFPNLQTLYGAIRSAYMTQKNISIDKIEEETKDFKINGVYFYDENEQKLLFLSPDDLYIFEEKLRLLKLKRDNFTSNQLDYIFFTADDNIEKRKVFMKSLDFKRYLNCKTKEFSFNEIGDYIISEFKIGIGKDNGRRYVEDGKLYRVEMKRYKGLSLIIDFEGLELEKRGLLKVGGEGKGMYYEEFENLKIPEIKTINSNVFKLYCLTPSIFKNGWYPDFLDNEFIGEIEGTKVKLIASAVNYEYIGGWDIKNNKPKKMFKAVSSGSVYYFKILDNKENLFKISNIMEEEFCEYKKQGFGKVFIANCEEGL